MSQTGFIVKASGVLSLIQDLGRFGQAELGLTQGGPADLQAFTLCNRLLSNDKNAAQIEVTMGGLKLVSSIKTRICVTGAHVPLYINGKIQALCQVHLVQAGDIIEFGFAQNGTRAYLGVCGGFQVIPQFGSCSTVVREGIGGLHGTALKIDDLISAKPSNNQQRYSVSRAKIPSYTSKKDRALKLRLIAGYQFDWFDEEQITAFCDSEYTVSKQWDRMGYRLMGTPIQCKQSALLSEGITYGAVQIPADGQPIILLNDRQTIGGYPKLGSILSIDAAKLAQSGQGTKIKFEVISLSQAQAILSEAHKVLKHSIILPVNSHIV